MFLLHIYTYFYIFICTNYYSFIRMKKYILPFRHPERELRQLVKRSGFVLQQCRFVSHMRYKSDYLIRK